MTHDTYRPKSIVRMEGYLDAAGKVTGFRGRIAVQSTLAALTGNPDVPFDPFATEGLIDRDYRFPALNFEYHSPRPGIPVGFYRGVGFIHNTFYRESFMDELAHAAGRDPIEFRLELAGHNERNVLLLNTLAERSDWGVPAPGNVQGAAFAYSDESTVGQVFEGALSSDGRVRLRRITCVCDVGVYMNPMLIEHQMESAITWGLTSAMFGEILIDNGATRQKNFLEDGGIASWRIEGETRNDLYRNGWREDSLQPGDAVTVRVNPARDASRRYARLLSLERADGTVLAIPNAEDERGRDNAVPAAGLEGVWLPIQTFPAFAAKLAPLTNERARAERAQQTGLPPPCAMHRYGHSATSGAGRTCTRSSSCRTT